MRLVGRGHPAIRATHDKTLELTADPDVTERGTCVVAVDVAPVAAPVAGPVRVTIRAGAASFAFEARANPNWDPRGPAVIRRSPFRLPGTLATDASAAARDLPRDLVAALRDPSSPVEITVEPIAGPPCVVLFALDPQRPDDPALAAERAAADVLVAEDEEAAHALGVRVAPGPVTVDGRVLVVAARDLPGATVLAALPHVQVEAVGLAPPLAAAAASPSRGPVVFAQPGADPRRLLRATPAGDRLVLPTRASGLGGLLRLAEEIRGVSTGVAVQPYGPPLRVDTGTRLPSGADAYVCLDAPAGDRPLDPAVRAAIDGLLADQVPTRVVARALAALTGWDRRRAYDAVLHWRA